MYEVERDLMNVADAGRPPPPPEILCRAPVLNIQGRAKWRRHCALHVNCIDARDFNVQAGDRAFGECLGCAKDAYMAPACDACHKNFFCLDCGQNRIRTTGYITPGCPYCRDEMWNGKMQQWFRSEAHQLPVDTVNRHDDSVDP